MEGFRELSVTSPEPDDFEERGGRSPLFIIISVICALAITAALLFGYMFLRGRHHEQEMASQRAQTPASKSAPPAEVMVFEDEAMLKGSNAIIGGKVQNISSGTLTDLTVELELTRREGSGTEKRSLAIEPKELAPNQQGSYSLSVPSREFSTARLLHVRSGARPGEIGFRTAPGAQRPPEPTPQTTKTIIVNRPAPRGSGDEYINSPDKPATIP
jgi:hypothetical protein